MVGVHAHVEGTIKPEAEATLGHIQLRTAHPTVDKHGTEGNRRLVGAEIGGFNPHPIPEGSQPVIRGGPGRRILIKADQLQVGVGLEQQGAVTASAKGAIQKPG
jgi:hypothetical protein